MTTFSPLLATFLFINLYAHRVFAVKILWCRASFGDSDRDNNTVFS